MFVSSLELECLLNFAFLRYSFFVSPRLSGDGLQHQGHRESTGSLQSYRITAHIKSAVHADGVCVCACPQWNCATTTLELGTISCACRAARRRTPTRSSSARRTPQRAAAAAPSVTTRVGRRPKPAPAACRARWASSQTPLTRDPTEAAISVGSATLGATWSARSAFSAALISASRAPADKRRRRAPAAVPHPCSRERFSCDSLGFMLDPY